MKLSKEQRIERQRDKLERKQANQDYPPLTGIGSRYHAPSPKLESLSHDPDSGSGHRNSQYAKD